MLGGRARKHVFERTELGGMDPMEAREPTDAGDSRSPCTGGLRGGDTAALEATRIGVGCDEDALTHCSKPALSYRAS